MIRRLAAGAAAGLAAAPAIPAQALAPGPMGVVSLATVRRAP